MSHSSAIWTLRNKRNDAKVWSASIPAAGFVRLLVGLPYGMQASSFARNTSRYEEINAVNGADRDRAMKRLDRQRKKKVGTHCFSGDLSSCGPKIPLYWAGCYHDNKMRHSVKATTNPCQVV